VEAACVHAVLWGNAVSRIEASPLRALVVTNTLAADREAHRQARGALRRPLFAAAIQAIHDGSSVSRLFR
jgi:ribose-phosphate pyrophosphokinase